MLHDRLRYLFVRIEPKRSYMTAHESLRHARERAETFVEGRLDRYVYIFDTHQSAAYPEKWTHENRGTYPREVVEALFGGKHDGSQG